MEALVEQNGAAATAAEAERAGGSDPFGFELFRNAIFAIADEMALTVCRTTYSGVLRDNMDFSTALTDGDGRLIAQGLTLPGHLGSVPTAIESVLRHYGDDIHPGDIFVMNDPFDGGMHLPDIFIFKPVFDGDDRLAFAATVCHHADVGGRVAGSNASDSTEIYQEGVRIPPLRLYDKGHAQRDPLRAAWRRTCACPSSSSATSAPSLPRATSRSASSSSWWSSTARRPRASTCARSSTMPSASPAPRCASCRTARPASRTGSTTTASTAASRSACSSRSARRAAACTPTGRARPRRSRARSTARCPGPRPPPTRRSARSCPPAFPTTRACSAPSPSPHPPAPSPTPCCRRRARRAGSRAFAWWTAPSARSR